MGEYPGATEAELIELGKLTIVSAEVEETVRSLNEALGLAPDNSLTSVVVRRVRDKIAASGLPPWATADRGQVIRWLEQALTALDERNTHVHAFVAAIWAGNAWQRQARHPKTGLSSPRNSESIAKTVARMAVVRKAGHSLHLGLLAEMRSGVFVKRYVHPGSAGMIITQQGDSYPERANTEEIEAFWSAWDREHPAHGWPL